MHGAIEISEDGRARRRGQVGWLDRPQGEGNSAPRLVAGEGARVVLYAGQLQGDPVVLYGAFIGDTKDDSVRLYAEYRAGRLDRLSEFARPRQQTSARGSSLRPGGERC
jgi:redox-sensitive bicupin YhaK (pirin superfamily)